MCRRLVVVVAALSFAGASSIAAERGQEEQQGAASKQAPKAADGKPTVRRAKRFAVTPPLRDLAKQQQQQATPLSGKARQSSPNPPVRPEYRDSASADQALQSVHLAPVPNILGPPIVSFDGPNIGDTAIAGLGGVLPPDTNGAVGPAHYIAATNLTLEIFDKTGASLLGPVATSAFFTALGGGGNPAGCELKDDGDPIVLYDHLADRWLISQFAVNVGAGPFFQCIAISQTPDPTGAYYAYEFEDPNNNFADYPHYGVWADGYYLTVNEFNAAGTAFVAGGNHVFERDKMLVGDPSALDIYFQTPLWAGGLPSDLDGPPPAAGTPNVFAFYDADEFGGTDSLTLFDFSVDWTTPANSTFTMRTESPIAVSPFDPTDPPGRNDIPQPPPSTGASSLDSIQDRLMHRLQYRNFGTHVSLVTNHTVDVDPTAGYQAGVRYYELRDVGAGFVVSEQASYAPDADHRWMGSAAMDAGGNLAVGFSVSSTTTFPSIRYAGRCSTDSPGGLFQGEQTLIAGTASQTHGSGRWGDYSALSVDPVDDCTFWYTQEYYDAADTALCPGFGGAITACWRTRVGSFTFSGAGLCDCTIAATGTLQGTVTDAGTTNPLSGAVVNANGYAAITDGSGNYSIANAAPGTYDVTAARLGYVTGAASGVSVIASATTVQDFALVGVPVVVFQSSAIDDTTSGNSNGEIDANECVDLDITFENIGGGAATGLSGALSTTTPEVTFTIDTRAYPDIPAGGTSTNSFSYALSTSASFAAGTPIDLTIDLKTDQGPLQFTTQLSTNAGTPGTPVTFSTSTPVTIIDNATVNSPVTASGLTDGLFDVEVELYITHTWDSDLTAELVAPDGSAVTLFAAVGGSGDNFGTNCPAGANDTRLSDGAATAIGAGAAPFVGTFLPQQPLASFQGLTGTDINGTWNLRVSDSATFDSGNIECWALTVTTATPAPGPGSCAVEVPIFEDGFESGDTTQWSNTVP